jgi:fimbrial chaperone protein
MIDLVAYLGVRMLPLGSYSGVALSLSVLALVSYPLPVEAMSVQPTLLDIILSGAVSAGQINVINENSTPLPVEIQVTRIELGENGQITKKPADEEFLIFPPQALISSGATQSFRVQWAGDPQIKASQSYIVSMNQVPVRMPKGTSGVQVVFNFATIVNVAPATGKSGLDLVSAGVGKDDNGKLRPALTVKNPGNIHAKLTDATIKMSGGSWSQTLRPDQLRQVIGVGLVQPGKTRRFLLPLDLPAGVSQLTASIDYKPAK